MGLVSHWHCMEAPLPSVLCGYGINLILRWGIGGILSSMSPLWLFSGNAVSFETLCTSCADVSCIGRVCTPRNHRAHKVAMAMHIFTHLFLWVDNPLLLRLLDFWLSLLWSLWWSIAARSAVTHVGNEWIFCFLLESLVKRGEGGGIVSDDQWILLLINSSSVEEGYCAN